MVRKEWSKYIGHIKRHKGRGLSIDFNFRGGLKLRIVNSYFPSRNSPSSPLIPDLTAWVRNQVTDATHNNMALLLMGDFNGTMSPPVDRRNYAHNNTSPETQILKHSIDDQLVDTFRHFHPFVLDYTFQNNLGASRIDMIFSSTNLLHRLTEARIAPAIDFINTDHRPAFAVFDTKTATRPASQAQLRRYKIQSKRIMTRQATKADWEAFTKELADTKDPPHVITASHNTNIDSLWSAIRDRVHAAAHNTLPVQKVGGVARVPCEQQRFAHRCRALGSILYCVKKYFQDNHSPNTRKRPYTLIQHHHHHLSRQQDAPHMQNVPAITAPSSTWMTWKTHIQKQYRDAQLEQRCDVTRIK